MLKLVEHMDRRVPYERAHVPCNGYFRGHHRQHVNVVYLYIEFYDLCSEVLEKGTVTPLHLLADQPC